MHIMTVDTSFAGDY